MRPIYAAALPTPNSPGRSNMADTMEDSSNMAANTTPDTAANRFTSATNKSTANTSAYPNRMHTVKEDQVDYHQDEASYQAGFFERQQQASDVNLIPANARTYDDSIMTGDSIITGEGVIHYGGQTNVNRGGRSGGSRADDGSDGESYVTPTPTTQHQQEQEQDHHHDSQSLTEDAYSMYQEHEDLETVAYERAVARHNSNDGLILLHDSDDEDDGGGEDDDDGGDDDDDPYSSHDNNQYDGRATGFNSNNNNNNNNNGDLSQDYHDPQEQEDDDSDEDDPYVPPRPAYYQSHDRAAAQQYGYGDQEEQQYGYGDQDDDDDGDNEPSEDFDDEPQPLQQQQYTPPGVYYNQDDDDESEEPRTRHQYDKPKAFKDEEEESYLEENGAHDGGDENEEINNSDTGEDEEEFTEHTYNEDEPNTVASGAYQPQPQFGYQQDGDDDEDDNDEMKPYGGAEPEPDPRREEAAALQPASHKKWSDYDYEEATEQGCGVQKVDSPFQATELKRAKQWIMILACISCILLLIIAIVIPVLALRDNDDDDAATDKALTVNPSTPPPSLAPVPDSPSPAPSTGGPRQCFETTEELMAAVDTYLTGEALDDLIDRYGFPIGTWCVSLISNFNSLFSIDRNPDVMTFNEDISNWDMVNATDMGSMFDGARAFAGDLSKWKVGRNRNLTQTFAGTYSFNSELSNWETSLVREMRNTFFRATAFNQDISTWDVSQVLTMRGTFLLATSFNQDLSSWRLDSVVSMNSMLAEAASFRHNMCAWGTQLQNRTVDVLNMFDQTQCPLGLLSPSLESSPPGPFCFACIDSALFPTQAPVAPSTPAPVVSPTVVPSLPVPPTAAPVVKATLAPVAPVLTLSPVAAPTTAAPEAAPTTAAPIVKAPPIVRPPNYNLICPLLPDCSVLDDPSTPQARALNWLQESTFFSNENKIQRYALATIYYSTEGDTWATNTFWLSNVDACLWYATTCGPSRELIALQLERNVLFGTLPFEVGLLTTLQTLSFRGNVLGGDIPGSLGSLVDLEVLRLDANFFTSNIPSELGALTNLSLLRLDNNDFQGLLPNELCSLTSSATQLSIFLDCDEVTAPCSTTCCSNETPCT